MSGKVARVASTDSRVSAGTSSLNRNESECLIMAAPSGLQDEAQSRTGRQRLLREDRAAQPEAQPGLGRDEDVLVAPDVGVELAVPRAVHDEGGADPDRVAVGGGHPDV